jgi:hypothetical protein
MKSRGRWLTVPIAILVALAIAAPVSAGSSVGSPDAQVRRAGGPQLGDNIYNLDGSGQTVGGHRARRYQIGAVRWFYVYAYNDGTAGDRYTIDESKTFTLEIAAASLIADPYLVQYYSPSGADITTAVQAGTFTTPTLAPGGRYGIKVKITVTSAAGHGSGVRLLMTVSSFTQPLAQDAVGIRMRRR